MDYAVQSFIGTSGTKKTLIISHVRLFMIISHVKIIAVKQSSIAAFGYFILLEKTVVYIIKRNIHGCLEISDLFLVVNTTFNTRNKSGISVGIVCCFYRNIV